MEFDRDKLNEELLKDFDDKTKVVKKPEIDLDSEPGIPIKILVPLVVIAAIVVGVYAWKTDRFAINRKGAGEIPLIKADAKPVRVVPVDPGGMYIANRDKLIYETISNNEETPLPKVVKILPRHEEPIERESIKKDENKDTIESELKKSDEKQLEKQSNAEVKVAEIDNSFDTKIVKKQELLSSDVSVLEGSDESKEAAITVDDIKNIPVPTISARGLVAPTKEKSGIKIQLGSFRTEADVDKNWASIKKKNQSLLKGLVLKTEKADLGDKGIFYRLRVGSLSKESEARKLCQKLIEQNQGCFVVKK